jgi:maleate cis-trans isomerase
MVASERIGVYVTRIPYANPVTPENLHEHAAVADGGRDADPA